MFQYNDMFCQAFSSLRLPRETLIIADQRGLNTSIIVSPNGECVGRTRKLHIPVTEGYFEDHYFTEGPADNPYPVHTLALDGLDLKVGNPTRPNVTDCDNYYSRLDREL